MYADLRVNLKWGVSPVEIKRQLASYLSEASITPAEAVTGTALANYAKLVVGAARFPSDIKVIYLCSVEDVIQVSVYGNSVPQLKMHCIEALKQLRKVRGVKVSKASASILIPDEGTDVDILSGQEAPRLKLFKDALVDRWVSKGITAVVNVTGALIIFKPTDNPALTAAIGLAATVVGIFFEAIHSTLRAESWSWKESK